MMVELDVFAETLKKKKLKMTEQRKLILAAFLGTEDHVSLEELYEIVRKKDPTVGQATVFRTMKLLVEAGFAGTMDAGDKTTRYEHSYNHSHHDHLVCVKCGSVIDFQSKKIESLQNAVSEEHDFQLTGHRLELYGVCSACRNKEKP